MPKPELEIHTSPDGYQFYQHEPDDENPTGKTVLVPGQSRLRERLQAAGEDNRAAHQALHDQRREALTRKQNAERACPSVPSDKRVV